MMTMGYEDHRQCPKKQKRFEQSLSEQHWWWSWTLIGSATMKSRLASTTAMIFMLSIQLQPNALLLLLNSSDNYHLMRCTLSRIHPNKPGEFSKLSIFVRDPIFKQFFKPVFLQNPLLALDSVPKHVRGPNSGPKSQNIAKRHSVGPKITRNYYVPPHQNKTCLLQKGPTQTFSIINSIMR